MMSNTMIFDNLTCFGNAIAIIDDAARSLTFEELIRAADSFSEQLMPRRLIFILCSNHPSAIVGYVGALRKRVVPLLLSADIQSEQLDRLIDIYKPSYLWASSAREFPEFQSLFDDGDFRLSKTNLPPFRLNDELALLLSTSGSTGSPKLVRQSYRNISANTQSIVEYLKLTPADRAITSMPMYYTYGLSIIQTQLNCGGSLIVTEANVLQRRFWDLLKEHRATNFGGVPYTYEMLKRMRFERMQLPSSMRFLTQARGKLVPKLTAEFVDACQAKGIEFITMYGACEATARMSFLPWQDAPRKIGSIGIAIPGGQFSIKNLSTDEDISQPNVEGELIYRGANVTLGYAERGEDLSLGDENGGVLCTGDLAKFDEDGYFYITGRKKRFLKIFGNRVSLDAVEAFLKSCGYLSCACTGVDDQLQVYVADDSDMNEMRRQLSQFTRLHASAFKIIRVDAIPRNASGKILYEKLGG